MNDITNEPEFQELAELIENMDDEKRQRTFEYIQANHSPILNTKEAAEYLNLHKNTLLKWTANGTIPAKRIGRQWRYHREELDEWIKSR